MSKCNMKIFTMSKTTLKARNRICYIQWNIVLWIQCALVLRWKKEIQSWSSQEHETNKQHKLLIIASMTLNEIKKNKEENTFERTATKGS